MKLMIRIVTLVLIILAAGTGWLAINTHAHAAAATADKNSQLAASILKDIHKATWIAEGKGTRVVYVFFDPNCPYCQKLFVNTRPWVQQGKLQLRWIPTGTLTTTSKGKAAALLQSKDPLQALHQNAEHYGNGGGLDEDLADARTEKQIKSNEELLARTQHGYVPTMLFVTKDGTPTMVTGSPKPERLQLLLDNVK